MYGCERRSPFLTRGGPVYSIELHRVFDNVVSYGDWYGRLVVLSGTCVDAFTIAAFFDSVRMLFAIQSLISIASRYFFSKPFPLGNRVPVQPLPCSDLGCIILLCYFADPIFGRPSAVKHRDRYQGAFLTPRTPSVQYRWWFFLVSTSWTPRPSSYRLGHT
ncbi:hypothetical protein SAMN05421636_1011 [Pricia antarctica]|uniref:Uncharacterized protein n=1 Tax=Pricia antarctica TaxID=641691 RepID=A0A1G6VMK6_9FLAO|nr:hypothetical protein SAMN05421636_1011 [Pricia antarctica]